MKKEIYSSAMARITMKDECVGNILDSIDELPQEHETKHRKIRYIQILTAAAVFIFGSVTVTAAAGGVEWIKSFFADDQEITQSIYDLAAEIENFECKSFYDIEISPVGILCDEQDFYAILHVEQLPDNLKGEFIDFIIEPEIKDTSGYSWSAATDFDSEKNELIMKCTSPEKIFKEGQKLNILMGYHEYSEDFSKYDELLTIPKIAEVSFTLNYVESNQNTLNIDYSEYTCESIPERDYDFLFDTIRITPISMVTEGTGTFYADEMISSDIRIIFDDGTETIAGAYGSSGTSSYDFASAGNNTTLAERAELYKDNIVTASWLFDKPIDPDRITDIYLGSMRIYHN
ncbi:MAG: hypothetical protein ACI4JB_10495 [Porcipelethomonas sp.]